MPMPRPVAFPAPTLSAVLLAVTVAGCIGPGADLLDDAEAPPLADLTGSTFGYACLPLAAAHDDARAGGTPCLTALSRDDATLQEPFLATHPLDPQVLAVGVNLGPPVVERVAGIPEGESYVCELGIFVSEDGGGSWRETVAPFPGFTSGPLGPAPGHCAGDPALAFDPDGRLHVTGIARPGPGAAGLLGNDRGFTTVYARTDDHGRTWEEPVILQDNDESHDRNWMLLDPVTGGLFVVWQVTEGSFGEWTTELAWSMDRGATWRNQATDQRAPCSTDGPVVRVGDDLLFSCGRSPPGGGDRVMQVYAFDHDSGQAALRVEVAEEAYWPFLVPLATGRLLMVYEPLATSGSAMRISDDAGHTWSDAVRVSERLAAPGDSDRVYWPAAGPAGEVHLLVRVAHTEAGPPVVGGSTRFEVRHLVLDADLARVQDSVLAAWGGRDPPTLRPAQRLGDHFFGIALHRDQAVLAFTQDGAIQLTLAVPLPPAALEA